MDNILNKVTDTVLERPIVFEVEINRTWWQRLLKKPATRTFVIKPIKLGSLIKISELLLSIDPDMLKVPSGNALLEANYKALEKHGETLAKVVAIAICNKKEDPPQSLVDFILNHFDASEIKVAVSKILRQMQVGDFMISIVSIRAMNVMEQKDASVINARTKEASPEDQGSLIAPGILSAVS